MADEGNLREADPPIDKLAKAFVGQPYTRRGVVKLSAGLIAVATAGTVPQWAFAKKKRLKCPKDCSHNVCGDDPDQFCLSTRTAANNPCRCMQPFTGVNHHHLHHHCECVEDICPKSGATVDGGEFQACDAHDPHCPEGSVCVYPHCCSEVGSFCAPLCGTDGG